MLSSTLSQPPYSDLGEDQHLQPVLPQTPSTVAQWEQERERWRGRWLEVLGEPSLAPFDPTPECVETFDLPEARATVMSVPTSAHSRQQVVLLEPRQPARHPCPGAVVPFYNPDLMIGYDLETKEPKDAPLVHFGRHLVQQGYVVVCGQAFPYNTVPDPQSDAPFAWWKAAAAKLLEQNPNWTGMGRLIWDARSATDVLLQQPHVDHERVVIIGHSLGGKIAFYAGCLDERIKAIVASDFGIGPSFTNWDAPWYLGDKVHDQGLGVGHHHLLGIHAPRSFLLLAGACDGPASWQYINAARGVYQLYGKENAVGIIDHASGHRPTEPAMRTAYTWLAEQFRLDDRPWTL